MFVKYNWYQIIWKIYKTRLYLHNLQICFAKVLFIFSRCVQLQKAVTKRIQGEIVLFERILK